MTTHIDLEPNTVTHPLAPGPYHAYAEIPSGFLNLGVYRINIRIWGSLPGQGRQAHATAMSALQFSIEETGSLATQLNDQRGGLVTPRLRWHLEQGLR
ncbi:MAG: hypothetical protein HC915_05480 [Anaerolineae bacterium]|nr:hypothetical protein [Anaerolineae bacterium]